MSTSIDLTGLTFGKLTVLERSKNPALRKEAKWLCICECGRESIVFSSNLRTGHTTSCGCNINRIEHILPRYEGFKNRIYISYQKSAIRRSISFLLLREEVIDLVTKNCFYCGIEPEDRSCTTQYNGKFPHHGIDRVNNEIGYLLENCVSCCKTCNTAKKGMTHNNFLLWIKNAYLHLFIRQTNLPQNIQTCKTCDVSVKNYYKYSAKRMDREFLLELNNIISLIHSNCHYCGIPAHNTYKYSVKRHECSYTYNGIDRLDNSTGYIQSNCVPCCKTCNYAKHTMSYDQFLAWISRVSSHLLVNKEYGIDNEYF